MRNSKLHDALTELLWCYDASTIEVIGHSDGVITLSAKYNPTETSVWGLENDELTFTMVIDENTYEVRHFEWLYHHGSWNYCQNYREEGKDIEYGVEIDIPEAVAERLEYALPQIWK